MRRWMVAALAACCVTGALAVTTAARPAQALTVQTVEVPSASNSTAVKSVQAVCPAGTVLYGGGARIVGGGEMVTFLLLQPTIFPTVSGYSAVAIESPPGGGDYPESWSMHVYARCGTGLSGVQVVSATGTANDRSPSQYQIKATCPHGKLVLGGGFSSSYISVPVHWIRPVDNGTAIQAVIHEDWLNTAFASDPVTVGAYAICATTPAGWWLEVEGTQPLQTNPQVLAAECPAGEVLGGGLTMLEGSVPGAIRMTRFFPDPDGDYFAVAGGNPYFPARGGPPFALGAWAICASV